MAAVPPALALEKPSCAADIRPQSFRGSGVAMAWAVSTPERAGESLLRKAAHDRYPRETITMRFRPIPRFLLLPAGLAWVAAVACGAVWMLDYQFRPGAAGAPAPSWPAASGIRRGRDGAQLVMVVHPRCPCTRASLAELEHVLARAPRSLSATLLFYRPREFAPGWEQSDLWRRAAAMPGVSVLADPEGREAQRFGAVTSGHVLLFDRAGHRLFSGGITGSRGHVGENSGCESVIRLLTGGGAARRQTTVFGCSIRPVPAGFRK